MMMPMLLLHACYDRRRRRGSGASKKANIRRRVQKCFSYFHGSEQAGWFQEAGAGCSGFGPDAFEREMHLRRSDDGIRFQEIGEGRRWGWMDGRQPEPVHKTVSGCALCYKLLIFVPLRFILTIGLVVGALGVSQKEFPEAWKIYCHLGFSKS